MAHIKNNQQALLTRVKKIRGQLNAVEKSLTKDTECLAILQQVTAIKGAVNGLMTTILDDHIRAHLGNPELTDTQRNEEIDALSKLLKSYLR